jgi:hypothetical protein
MTSPGDSAVRSAENATSQLEVEREQLEGGRYILFFSWRGVDNVGDPRPQSSTDDV